MNEIELLARLDGIEGMLATLLERKVEKGPEYLSPEEVAVALHRKAYTVREWCRLGRIVSVKDEFNGRPTIPVAEFERLKSGGGLLPPRFRLRRGRTRQLRHPWRRRGDQSVDPRSAWP